MTRRRNVEKSQERIGARPTKLMVPIHVEGEDVPVRIGGSIVNAPTARRRKPADPQATRFVRASVTVDAALHARWSAAASLAGLDRNAFAVEALRKALEGIVVVDRRKPSDRAKMDDRPDQRSGVSSDELEAA